LGCLIVFLSCITNEHIKENHEKVIVEIKQLDKIKRDFMESIELAQKNRNTKRNLTDK